MVWHGVLSGRWSIVEHFDDDRDRCFLAKQRDPAAPPAPGLSERERQIVALASRGHSNKLIAYELGVGSSTVAAHLTSAARKLGISSREVLLHASAVLDIGGPERAAPFVAATSPSERRDPVVRMSQFQHDGQTYAWIRIEIVPKLPASLTSAEAEVATLVIAGLSNTSIAIRRNTSVRTVANQLRSIYAKLSLGSRRQLCSQFSVERSLDGRNFEVARQ